MIRLPNLAQLKAAADVARDWAALLYTPVLTAYAVWVTAIIVWAHPWAKTTESLRLNFLGGALIAALCLIGLGTLFYQRRPPPRIRARTAAGELEIGPPSPEAPACEDREGAEKGKARAGGEGRGRRGPGLGAGGSSRRA